MNIGWSPVYLALWLAAAGGEEESFLGLHTELPNVFRDEDEFDAQRDRELGAGLEVVYVVENSPAQQAGCQVGDVLLRLNGRRPRSPGHLESLVATLPPGSEVTLEVGRGSQLLRLRTRTVIRLVPQEPPRVEAFVERRRLGLVVEEVVSHGGPQVGGVRIRRFLRGGLGPDAGLEAGDVVVAIGRETVHGGEDFLVLARDLVPGTRVGLLVSRGGERHQISAEIRDPGRYVSKFFFPLVVDFERDVNRDKVSFGLLPFNLIKYERRENRRTYCFLWFICLSTGSNELLEDVE